MNKFSMKKLKIKMILHLIDVYNLSSFVKKIISSYIYIFYV